MNVNDMIDTILNFDLDVVLAGLNESSHHLSQMEFISLIVITVGAVLLCLTGLKLVRFWSVIAGLSAGSVSYTHLRAHETDSYLVCRLLLEKKKKIS